MKKLLLVVTVLIAFIVSIVYAQPHTGFQGDIGIDLSEGEINKTTYVLVAYDEEMASYEYWWRNRWVSAQEYMRLQTVRSLYRLPWQYVIAGYETFTSPDDAQTMDDITISMETQLDWTHGSYNGKYVDGHWCIILVGWTNQQGSGYAGGCAHWGKAATLTRYQVDWADDNTLQEEVSHLYGYVLKNHCQADDCVLSQKYVFYYDVWESLSPVEEGGYWVAIWNWEMVGYISTTWCSPHYTELRQSNGHPISSLVEAEILPEEPISNPPTSPAPKPVEKDALNPPNPWIPILLVVVILGLTIAVLYYFLIRRRKSA